MNIEVVLALALLVFVAYVAGYVRGKLQGYTLGSEIRTIRVESGAITATIHESVIHRYLDQRDMIAVPKGADFQPGKEQA